MNSTIADRSRQPTLTQAPCRPPVRGIHSFRLRLIGEWGLLVCLLVVFLKASFLPGWLVLRSEFPNYYLASLLHHKGVSLERAYEWTWFQRQNDRFGVYQGLVSFAPNPPASVLPLLPLASLRPITAKRLWLSVNLVFLVASVWILNRASSLGWRRVALITLLCVVPLRLTFFYGRYYVLILLLLSAAYYACRRGHELTSGVLLSAAAALKLFPGIFLLLLLWKKNWRALTGFIVGGAGFLILSLFTFGLEVHRVFLDEVLSQVFRGDWLAPYYLPRNTYSTIWSHLFLFEPELNPSPLIHSPVLYALAQAGTVTLLLFAFLRSINFHNPRQSAALEWAATIPLMLLLSTTTGTDHACVLITSAVVAFDALLALGHKQRALTVLLLCAAIWVPIPARVLGLFPLVRLAALTALYLLILRWQRADRGLALRPKSLAAAAVCFVLLGIINLRLVRNRGEDLARRLPTLSDGYRATGPSPVRGGLAFTEVKQRGYTAMLLRGKDFDDVPAQGDVLALAGAENDNQLYLELTGRESLIARLATERLDSTPQNFIIGQEPVLSPNGAWLAFMREERGRSALWLVPSDSSSPPQMILPQSQYPVDATVSGEGDVIAAVGPLSDPHLVFIRRVTRKVESLAGYPNPARYPAISPDGKRLAFSQRQHGFWHLLVRDLTTGSQQMLTHTECNATAPSWQNSNTLLYATDCGRGVGLSALARVLLPE